MTLRDSSDDPLRMLPTSEVRFSLRGHRADFWFIKKTDPVFRQILRCDAIAAQPGQGIYICGRHELSPLAWHDSCRRETVFLSRLGGCGQVICAHAEDCTSRAGSASALRPYENVREILRLSRFRGSLLTSSRGGARIHRSRIRLRPFDCAKGYGGQARTMKRTFRSWLVVSVSLRE